MWVNKHIFAKWIQVNLCWLQHFLNFSHISVWSRMHAWYVPIGVFLCSLSKTMLIKSNIWMNFRISKMNWSMHRHHEPPISLIILIENESDISFARIIWHKFSAEFHATFESIVIAMLIAPEIYFDHTGTVDH